MAVQPLQLLEINVISAQDLAPVSKKMQTYATAWVHPTRKLSTRVDSDGDNNPTWNDKFVFRVDEDFLRSDTSAVMIEIYGVHWLRDKHVGSVRILVGNLIPPVRNNRRQHHLGMRFVALQVRRRSGRPQGILNIGVTLLDSSMRSMPLYTHLCASAVGFHDLMNDDDIRRHYHNNNNNNNNDNNNENETPPPAMKPILLRSRSERSERVKFDDDVSYNGSSVVGFPQRIGYGKSGSVISGSDFMDPPKGKGKKGKASSVISGAELREKKKGKGKKSRASSVVNVAELKTPPKDKDKDKENPNSPIKDPPKEKLDADPQPKKPISAPKPIPKQNAYDYWPNNGKYMYGGPKKAKSIWSDSEVGPSPSEVAAAMAEQRYPLDDGSLLDGWSLDESVEGLRSKLDRWRTELPPLYDQSMSMTSYPTTSQHTRRHTDGGGSSGLFSCFGNFMGYECQCICGKPPKTRRRSYGGHYHSPSATVPRAFM